jgi:Protein of unknown function (DUF2924)
MSAAPPSLPEALAVLTGLNRAALAERWTGAFGCPAPRSSQAAFLRSALAWHAQMERQASAGSSSVDRLIRGLRKSLVGAVPSARPGTGTRLLRDWQGRTHHVTVLTAGFEYNGKTYRSLSAIARQITGTAWSGPLFFGLRP